MAKILHLSDLHLGYEKKDDYRTNRNFKIIISNIIESNEMDSDSCAIVITGDIAHNAVLADYEYTYAGLEELKNNGYKVYIVPGNHDYRAPGLGYRRSAINKYNEVFHQGEEPQYPIIDEFDDLILIGLNSFEGKFIKNGIEVEASGTPMGKLGERQLLSLKTNLEKLGKKSGKKIILYFHHHPFKFLQLQDSDPDKGDNGINLKEIIKSHNSNETSKAKIECLLYGHNHGGKTKHGKWDVIRCYDGSSSTQRHTGKDAKQRLIDFSCNNPEEDIDLNWI